MTFPSSLNMLTSSMAWMGWTFIFLSVVWSFLSSVVEVLWTRLVLRRGVPLPLFKLVSSLSGRWVSVMKRVWCLLFREMDIPYHQRLASVTTVHINIFPRNHLIPSFSLRIDKSIHDLSCNAIHPLNTHSILNSTANIPQILFAPKRKKNETYQCAHSAGA